MAYSLIDPDLMLSITCRLLGAWGILTTAQWLARLSQWTPEGAFGWDLQGLRKSRLYSANFLAEMFRPKHFRILLATAFAASSALAFAAVSWASVVALSLMIVTLSALNLRTTGDGADKMAMVVAYGLLLQMVGALTDLPLLRIAGFLWVGGQLTLAYATSGISKIILAGWRNGEVLRKTFSSYLYGHRAAYGIIVRPGVAVMLAWFVILIESLFPLTLISPLPLLAGGLCIMAAFHFATAALMGLNTYPLAFIAAYPSLLLLAQWIKGITY